MNCPLYHVYLDRHHHLVGQAHRAIGLRRSSLLRSAAQQRRRAQIELSKCHGHHGHHGSHRAYGSYGEYGGCGTFFGKTKDAIKRACYLEKKISKHQPCCDKDCSWFSGKGNQSNQCGKIAKWNAELAAIQAAEFGPQTYQTATDMQAQQYQLEIEAGDEQYRKEQAQTQRTIIIVGGGAGLALLAVMALR